MGVIDVCAYVSWLIRVQGSSGMLPLGASCCCLVLVALTAPSFTPSPASSWYEAAPTHCLPSSPIICSVCAKNNQLTGAGGLVTRVLLGGGHIAPILRSQLDVPILTAVWYEGGPTLSWNIASGTNVFFLCLSLNRALVMLSPLGGLLATRLGKVNKCTYSAGS